MRKTALGAIYELDEKIQTAIVRGDDNVLEGLADVEKEIAREIEDR